MRKNFNGFSAKFVEKNSAVNIRQHFTRTFERGLHAVIDVVTANTDTFIKFSNEWNSIMAISVNIII